MKIALIGAGSAVFSLNLMRDMCQSPYLNYEVTLCMMDIDEDRRALLALIYAYHVEAPVASLLFIDAAAVI